MGCAIQIEHNSNISNKVQLARGIDNQQSCKKSKSNPCPRRFFTVPVPVGAAACTAPISESFFPANNIIAVVGIYKYTFTPSVYRNKENWRTT